MHTVQEAIDEANSNLNGRIDIVVAEGTYYPTTAQWNLGISGLIPRDSTILLKTSKDAGEVYLHGGYLGCDDGSCLNPGSIDYDAPDGSFEATILSGEISGSDNYHHVLVADGNPNNGFLFNQVYVDGFMVVAGRADGDIRGRDFGAGITCDNDAKVRLEHITFEDNIAKEDGGAIYFAGKTISLLEIAHASLRENIAKRGGALGLNILRDVRMANVHFENNGNTVQDLSGWPPITEKGGAIFTNEEVKIICQNGLFHDNVANAGGTVYVIPLFSSESGDYHHTWRNCTFAFNAVPSDGTLAHGAGFEVEGDSPTSGADTDQDFFNCIFWRNGIGVDIMLGANITAFVDHTNWDMDTTASAGTFVTVADTSVAPKFKNPAARNLRLKLSSPLIDAGSNPLVGADVVDVDEDGNITESLPWDLDLGARVKGDAVDMGVYEAVAPAGGGL